MPAPTKAASGQTPRTSALSPRQRLRRRVLLGTMLALEVVMLGYAGASVMAAMSSMAPNPRARPITQTPAAFGLSYQTVSFPSRGDHLLIRGWLMPGLLPDGRQTVQRTIIAVHGIPGNRGSVLSVSAALVRHGFAVLALDLRGDGESAPAPLSLGEFEQRDILGAADFLRTGAPPFPLLGRPRAIGGWGMSLGASTLLLAAAAEPALRAIISDSAFADAAVVVRSWWEQRGLSWLLPGGLLAGRLLYGVNYAQARPVAVVAQIAPRPIWFIHGTADSTVPIANMDQLVAAASQPPNAHVQTWKVPGAQHVQAFSLMQETYIQRMVAFYQSALGPDSQ